MWNWYTSNSISKILPFNEYAPIGKIVNFELSHDTVTISIPEEVFTYQIQVKYPEGVRIYNLDGQNDFSFSHDLNHNGLFVYLSKNYDDVVKIRTTSKSEESNIHINFRGTDVNGQVIVQANTELQIKGIPTYFALHQNYPNPFNPLTTIAYDIPKRSYVKLVVYDITGKEIATLLNKEVNEGFHSVRWNSKDNYGNLVPAGIYFIQLQTNAFVKTNKMILLK